MFNAFIILCSVINQNNCMLLKNNLGEYPTEFQCQHRLNEMRIDIEKLLLDNPIQLRIKNMSCVKSKGKEV